jgi:sulfatase maturation enzyme AslB (radical SAM superfamily)
MKKLSADTPYTKCMSTPMLWGYVMASGVVSACSAYLLNPRFELGNINDQDFKTIWQGSKRQALFEEGIDISECRKNCRMDSCNRYLDEIANNKISNVNFI